MILELLREISLSHSNCLIKIILKKICNLKKRKDGKSDVNRLRKENLITV